MNSKLEELNSIFNEGDNEDEIEILEAELNSLTDDIIQEQGSFVKSYVLLNNCKVTKDFIRLEFRKLVYNNVVKLTSRDDNNVVTKTITDPVKIRGKMASASNTFVTLKTSTTQTIPLKIVVLWTMIKNPSTNLKGELCRITSKMKWKANLMSLNSIKLLWTI